MKEAAINVKSLDTGDSDPRLLACSGFEQNELTEKLKRLAHGFKTINHSEPQSVGLGLDYLRDSLVDLSQGVILPHDAPGPNNDIIDELSPILKDVIDNEGAVYLFGQRYKQTHEQPDKDGVHDVHMNQGSDPRYEMESSRTEPS